MNFIIDRVGKIMLVLVLVLAQLPVPVYAGPEELATIQNTQPEVKPEDQAQVTEEQAAEPESSFEDFMGGVTLSSAEIEEPIPLPQPETRYFVTGTREGSDSKRHFNSLEEAQKFVLETLNEANSGSGENAAFAEVGGPAFEVFGNAVLFSYEKDQEGGITLYLKNDVKTIEGKEVAKIDWSTVFQPSEQRDEQGRLVRETFRDGSRIDYTYDGQSLKSIMVTDPQGSSVKIIFEIENLNAAAGRIIAEAARDLLKQGKINDDEVLHLRNYQELPGYCTTDEPSSYCSRRFEFRLSNKEISFDYRLDENTRDGKRTYTVQLLRETLRETMRARREARRAVLADLSKVTGLSKEELKEVIESLTINTTDPNNIKVALKLKAGKMKETRLIDVLGNGDLPASIEYTFSREVTGQTASIPPALIYGERKLTRAHWTWPQNEGRYFHLGDVYYQDGRIQNVQWTNFYPGGSDNCGPDAQVCTLNYRPDLYEFVGQDHYKYKGDTILISSGSFLIGGIVGGPFESLNGGTKANDVLLARPDKLITLTKMIDGKHHISEILEYDSDGKILVKNKFEYLIAIAAVMCVEGFICEAPPAYVSLYLITRTDANGELLSEIYPMGREARVTFPVGPEATLGYDSFRNLLEQVARLEMRATQLRGLMVNDLVKNFGFKEKDLKKLIADGLVKIAFNLEDSSAVVTIDSSVKLRGDAQNLTDLLGRNDLPGEIRYRLGSFELAMGMACSVNQYGVVNCPPAPMPTYFLDSAEFNIGERYFELDYYEKDTPRFIGDNKLRTVRIYDGNPHLVCITAPCPTGQLVKEINYRWFKPCNGMYCLQGLWQDSAEIHYYNEGKETLRRFVNLNSGGFASFNFPPGGIVSVNDFRIDENGEAVLTTHNDFQYMVAIADIMCIEGSICEPPPPYYSLYHIEQTDAQGNLISSIDVQWFEADVKFADERTKHFSFKTIENLLNQVRAAIDDRAKFLEIQRQVLEALDNEITRMRNVVLAGDFNQDGIVNQADLDYMQAQFSAMEEALKTSAADYATMVEQLKAVLGQDGISAQTRLLIEQFIENSASAEEIGLKIQQFMSATRFNHEQRLVILRMDQDYLKRLEEARVKNAAAQSLEEIVLVAMPIPPPQAYQDPGENPQDFLTLKIGEGNALLDKAQNEIKTAFQQAQAQLLKSLDSEIERMRNAVMGGDFNQDGKVDQADIDYMNAQFSAIENALNDSASDYATTVEQLKAVLGQDGISAQTRLLIEQFVEGSLSAEEIGFKIQQFMSATRFNHEQRLVILRMDQDYLKRLEEARATNANAQTMEELVPVPAMPVPPPQAYQDPGENPQDFLTLKIGEGNALLEKAQNEIKTAVLQKVVVRGDLRSNYYVPAALSIPSLSSDSVSGDEKEEQERKRKWRRRLSRGY